MKPGRRSGGPFLFGYNAPMIYSAVDLCIEIDFGSNEPGAVLQYEDRGYWHDYLVDGKQILSPVDIETLQPGYYRQVESR